VKPGFVYARLAVAATFFINGAVFATWVSRIPGVKEALGLSSSRLGLALLAIGVGTVTSLPLTSFLIGRFGSRRYLIASALGCCVALTLAGAAPSYALLLPALLFYGAMLGGMDVAMNAQASLLERQARRSLMSSLHGLWSLGGLCGSALAGLVAARGLAPQTHFALVAGALALLIAPAARGLVPDAVSAARPPALAWPERKVVAFGAVAGCGAVIEGGIADWIGVFLRDSLGAGVSLAAGGFAFFSFAMMAARFAGDRLIDRVGQLAMLRGGSLLAGTALAAALLLRQPAVVIAALVLAGLGMATVFPIAFSGAGALPGAPGHAIAAVATMAYGAGLLGPPVIGFVADATSLPLALGLLVAACFGIVLLAQRLPLPGAAGVAP
jgi:fucose permease